MSYQYNHTSTYGTYADATLPLGSQTLNRYEQTIGGTSGQAQQPAPSFGTVGDILTGTVVQGGSQPIVEMNGTPIQVRSTALQNAKSGDRIYLQITQSSSLEITMKLMDPSTMSTATRNPAVQTDILKNTAKFVEDWKQHIQEHSSEYEDWTSDSAYLLQSVSDEEKDALRRMGVEITDSNLTFVKSLLSQMRGKEQDEELQRAINSVRKQIIISNPEEAPEQLQMMLHDQSINLSELTEEANRFLPISEEQTVYLLQNELPLTMENLYKSEYSASAMPTGTPLSDDTLQQLQPQVERAIRTAGLTVNEDSRRAADFLLQHQLPVNTETLQTYTAIQEINRNGFQDTVLAEQATDHLAELYSVSEPPAAIKPDAFQDMNLYFPSSASIADRISDDLQHITEEDFWAFANTGMAFTLQNLSAFSETTPSDPDAFTSKASTASIAALTAHRQLEEIRLKMTWEAGYRLASEDIHIRTKELSQVVEALRNQERDYYRQQCLNEDIEPTADLLKQLQETNQKVQELPYLPASSLGAVLFSGGVTVERLHEAGRQALSQMHPVSSKTEAYETLMTQPRRDLGDSIQKAFRNVDALLEELHLPVTEENQRAVRILGYNQMEVTPDTVRQVTAADLQVQNLIQNLQPSVVLNLIRNGVNPLQMPVEALNSLIQDYIHDEGIIEEERFSTFLQKLDRRGDITADERKGYIGIFRLIDKVVRSKGKDIGTLVRNGQPLTLQNLLTAHRSNRAAGMDAVLDETFGGFEHANSGESISQQIEAGFTERLYYGMTPHVIDHMVEEAANGTTLEEFFDTIQEQLTDPEPGESGTGVLNDGSQTTGEASIQEIQLQELDAFDEATYQFMKSMDVFPSITNMLASTDILKGNGRLFRKTAELDKRIRNIHTTSPESESSGIEEQFQSLPDHLNSPEDMEHAYAQLEQTITETVHQEDAVDTITARDIQALKQIRAGLRIMQKMSRNDQFQIPFSIDGEWNLMNLSIVQDAETKGVIEATVPTQEYGTITAVLAWNKNHWDDSVTTDTEKGKAFLDRNAHVISDGLAQITAADTQTETEPTTQDLYHIAKRLVMMVKRLDYK